MSEITLSIEHPSLGCGEIIARYDLSEIQKKAYEQGSQETIQKILDKIEEGVCDICEHSSNCYPEICGQEGFEKEAFIKWLKEQKNE